MSYDEKLCNEKYEKVKEAISLHNDRLNKHSEEIHELQQVSAARSAEVSSMCKSIDSLNQRIDKIIEQNRNLLITVITMLAGFFIFVVEKGIFK